jgi:RNA polymerase sigma-32 factor
MLGSSNPYCSDEDLDMSTLSVLSNLPAIRSESGLSRYLTTIRQFPLLSATDEATTRAAGTNTAIATRPIAW